VEQYGYDEVNLNIGCPSERVQRGAFGACLMAEPELVADCVRAMKEAVKIPVTVKHRLGLNSMDDFSFVEKFVENRLRSRLHHVHRPRAQCSPEGPLAEGESRGPAAQVRIRLPAEEGTFQHLNSSSTGAS
jgi:tRNA-dihydrouridine synthase